MITINVARIRLAKEQLAKVRKKVSDTADGIYRQKIYWLAEQAIRVSPQFSGDFASNWNLAVDGNMPVYRMWADKMSGSVVPHQRDNGTVGYRVHQAGDPEAVSSSLARVAGQLARVTRKNKVHIVNATSLYVDGTGQYMVGPDGKEKLRPENVIPTGTRIETYVRTMAQAIPKNLSDPGAS